MLKLPAFTVTTTFPAQMTPRKKSGNTFGLAVPPPQVVSSPLPQLLPPSPQPSGLVPTANMVCNYSLQRPTRKLLTTSGTKWPGIRLETQESTSDCSMHQEELHPPGLNADMLQSSSTPTRHTLLTIQTSSCSLTPPREHQSATPQKPSRWPNPVTSYLSSASNGLIS